MTTQGTAVKQIILNHVVHGFSSFRLNRFPFPPLFLNKSKARVKVAYPEQSHLVQLNTRSTQVPSKTSKFARLSKQARSRLMLCT